MDNSIPKCTPHRTRRTLRETSQEERTDYQVLHCSHRKNKLSTRLSEELDRDSEYEFVDAHANKELVFHYKPDKVLIEADFIFDLPATEAYSLSGESTSTGIATRIFAAIQNTSGSAIWQKRML